MHEKPVNFVDIANQSVASTLAIGAFIAIFGLVIAALNHAGLMPHNIILKGAISGMLELTHGTIILAQNSANLKLTVPILAGIISFGGLSVAVQSMVFLKKCNIKFSYYLLTKLTQTAITVAFCLAICLIVF
jgi:hypothetical protein